MTEDEALEQLRITQYHDKIKLEYCAKNNLPLVRIPYWEQDNIEDFLISKCKQYDIFLTQQNDYS